MNGPRLRSPRSYSRGSTEGNLTEDILASIISSPEFQDLIGGEVSVDPIIDNYSIVFDILSSSFEFLTPPQT